MTAVGLLVTRNSLLVSPFAEASGDKPPFAEATGDKPPFAEASGDKPPRRFAAPLRRGELGMFPLRAKFPSVGGVSQRDGVVRECGVGHLVPFVIARE